MQVLNFIFEHVWIRIPVIILATILAYWFIASVIVDGLWLLSKRASNVADDIFSLPIDVVLWATIWPRRQVDRRNFEGSFGFQSWNYESNPEFIRSIEWVLAGFAGAMEEASVRQLELQEATRLVETWEVREAKKWFDRTRKEFWRAHHLAERVAGYDDSCDSYSDHLRIAA